MEGGSNSTMETMEGHSNSTKETMEGGSGATMGSMEAGVPDSAKDAGAPRQQFAAGGTMAGVPTQRRVRWGTMRQGGFSLAQQIKWHSDSTKEKMTSGLHTKSLHEYIWGRMVVLGTIR